MGALRLFLRRATAGALALSLALSLAHAASAAAPAPPPLESLASAWQPRNETVGNMPTVSNFWGSATPSTDPLDLIERKGFLTSLGGTPEGASHKGYGLAAMARILSAGLAGAPMLLRPEEASQPRTGSLAHFFFVMDPALFRDGQAFRDDVAGFCESLRQTRPVDPQKPVQVAGDPERANAATRSQAGIPVGAGLLALVRTLAQASGARWIMG
jgi:hypothetical protein